VIAEEKNLCMMEKLFEKYVKDYPVLSRPLELEDEAFYKVINMADTDNLNNKTDFEGFTTETRAGFSSMTFLCAPAGTQERAQETVLCHWLSDSFLWEMIRTKGGAYGAWIQNDGIEKTCTMTSYRDPNPENSLSVFIEALRAAVDAQLSDEDFERLITGTFSKLVQPQAPYDKGRIEATRYYYGITETDKEILINSILKLKKEELFEAAKRLLKSAEKKAHSAVIFNKIKKNIGKNINLVL
jgi:Zn-dependent M16 (insulinase) family peptidase